MSPERKSQPILTPSRQTQLLGDELLERKGTSEEKIDALTKAMVMVLETVDILTQSGDRTNQRIDDLSDSLGMVARKVDDVTNKIEEYVAVKLIRCFIGLSVTIIGGLGIATVVHIFLR